MEEIYFKNILPWLLLSLKKEFQIHKWTTKNTTTLSKLVLTPYWVCFTWRAPCQKCYVPQPLNSLSMKLMNCWQKRCQEVFYPIYFLNYKTFFEGIWKKKTNNSVPILSNNRKWQAEIVFEGNCHYEDQFSTS